MYNLYFSTCSKYSTKATAKRRKDVQKQEKEVKKENEATAGKIFCILIVLGYPKTPENGVNLYHK